MEQTEQEAEKFRIEHAEKLAGYKILTGHKAGDFAVLLVSAEIEDGQEYSSVQVSYNNGKVGDVINLINWSSLGDAAKGHMLFLADVALQVKEKRKEEEGNLK